MQCGGYLIVFVCQGGYCRGNRECFCMCFNGPTGLYHVCLRAITEKSDGDESSVIRVDFLITDWQCG